jgi:hypothetical protein
MSNTKKMARVIRVFRYLHRKIAIFLFVFFFIISITGFLLGWKKQTGMLAPTQTGTNENPSTWLSIDSLQKLAAKYLHDSVSTDLSTEIDRIDVRMGKGIAKFLFVNHYWGVQLDCATGKLLLIEKRNSDLIEDIHDGTIVDNIFGTGENAMSSYTAIMGISLFMLTATGFWLWLGPKRIRKAKRH